MSHNFNEILDQYIAAKQMSGGHSPFETGTGMPPTIPSLPYTPSRTPSLPPAAENMPSTSNISALTQTPTGQIVDIPMGPGAVQDQYPDPETMLNDDYLNAVLLKFLGQKVHVEFLMGTNNMVDRNGYLLDVGANYIIINESDTDDLLICDFYSIKFVRIYL